MYVCVRVKFNCDKAPNATNPVMPLFLVLDKCGKMRVMYVRRHERTMTCRLNTTNQVPEIHIGLNGT